MNSLDLNLPGEAVLSYKLYDEGDIRGQLRQLRSEQRRPLSVFDFVKRLEMLKLNPEIEREWNNLCPTLGDAIAWHPYGSVRIIGGSPEIWDYLIKKKTRNGAVELHGYSYDELGGLHIPGYKLLKKDDNYRKKVEHEIFSYLGISGDERRICFPKPRAYPCLTLLAFSNGGKVLGYSSLEAKSCLVGVSGNLWFR